MNKSFAIISNQTDLPPDLLASLTKHQNAICRLLAYDEKQNILSSCTASLIDKNLAISGAHCLQKNKKIKVIELLCGYQNDNTQSLKIVGSKTGNKTIYNQNLFKFRRNINTYKIPIKFIKNGMPNYDFVLLNFKEPIHLQNSEYLTIQSKKDFIKNILESTVPRQCIYAGYGADSQRLIGPFKSSQADVRQLNKDQIYEVGQFIPIESTNESLLLQNEFEKIEQEKKNISKSHSQYEYMIDSYNLTSLFLLARYAEKLPTKMSLATPGDSGSGLLCLNYDTGDMEVVAILSNVISNLQEVVTNDQTKKMKIITLGNLAVPFYHITDQKNVNNILDAEMTKTDLVSSDEE